MNRGKANLYMRCIVLGVLLLMAATLGGCKLAREDGRLKESIPIGIVISSEPIDMYHGDGISSENRLEGRSKKVIHKDGKETLSISFPNIKVKHYMILQDFKIPFKGYENISVENVNPLNCNTKVSINESESAFVQTMEVDISIVTSEDKDRVFDPYIVYLQEDGNVYLSKAYSSVAINRGSEGNIWSIENTYDENFGDKKYSYGTKINIIGIEPIKSYLLTLMNKENEKIRSLSVDANKIPSELNIEKNTAYIIVDRVYEGNGTIDKRKLFNIEQDDKGETIELFEPLDGGFFRRKSVNLKRTV